jgi:hypothetical protein
MNKTPAIGSFMDACIHEFTERVCVLGYSRDKKRCHVAISPQDNKSMNGITEWIDTSSLVLPSFPEAIMYAQVTEVSSWEDDKWNLRCFIPVSDNEVALERLEELIKTHRPNGITMRAGRLTEREVNAMCEKDSEGCCKLVGNLTILSKDLDLEDLQHLICQGGIRRRMF